MKTIARLLTVNSQNFSPCFENNYMATFTMDVGFGSLFLTTSLLIGTSLMQIEPIIGITLLTSVAMTSIRSLGAHAYHDYQKKQEEREAAARAVQSAQPIGTPQVAVRPHAEEEPSITTGDVLFHTAQAVAYPVALGVISAFLSHYVGLVKADIGKMAVAGFWGGGLFTLGITSLAVILLCACQCCSNYALNAVAPRNDIENPQPAPRA